MLIPNRLSRIATVAFAICAAAATLPPASADTVNRNAIRARVAGLLAADHPTSAGVDIFAVDPVSGLYERLEFRPAWADAGHVQSLLGLIESSIADGLDPVDYNVHEMGAILARFKSGQFTGPDERAAADIVLTESLIRNLHHRRFGKVDPETMAPNKNFDREIDGRDTVDVALEALAADSLAEFADSLHPRGRNYQALQQLRQALAAYGRIDAAGGWPPIPDGPTIRPGDADSRLAALADRLIISGDLDEIAVPRATYDATLRAAVQDFQARHGLEVDGIVGPRTLRALNVPVAQRLRQLRLALERARWMLSEADERLVLVNIAGFDACLLDEGDVRWEARVQVGTPDEPSPAMRGEMTYVVLNPTWTVPFSIATEEMLPVIREEPGYLVARSFDVFDAEGSIVDPATVDWRQIDESNFNYTFVQRPGPGNTLGNVKFMFPNVHSVSLHDTPNKSLFDVSRRALSHGCVRIQHPLELAELVLADAGYDHNRIDAVLESGKTTNVSLAEPVPVLLVYWTAEVQDDGKVSFYEDVYGHDEALARALDTPILFESP